jgi:retron-type reverse transcriptase
LAWLTYHRGATVIDHYHHFTIAKKSGGRRAISSPKAKLRQAQSWLLENVLTKVEVHEAAMAFRPVLNIAHNAIRHAGAQVIVRLDLKDFFPSITFKRVKQMFQHLGFNEGVATLFALLSTEAPRAELTLDGQKYFVAVTARFLPQGACTSPAITNILCRVLDKRLSGASQKLGFVYTRYADDLIFSARRDQSSGDKVNSVAMRDLATQIIADERFVVNDDKTAILRPRGRQTVTGLVVNAQNTPEDQGAPRVSRRDIRNFRAFLHQYERLGREAMTEKLEQDALSYARGYLSFIHMVSPQQAATIQEKHPWLERRQL